MLCSVTRCCINDVIAFLQVRYILSGKQVLSFSPSVIIDLLVLFVHIIYMLDD